MRLMMVLMLTACVALTSCCAKTCRTQTAGPAQAAETAVPEAKAAQLKLPEAKPPEIVVMSSQKVLQVEAKGDPNVAGMKAFALLFQLYYTMPATPKGPNQPAPRARWPQALDTPMSDWIGLYALPVPEGVTEIPPYKEEPGLKVSLTTWDYGDVAQVVHTGPYDKEEPTIQRLKDFISQQGYKISGPHEEEYLKGPTMYSAGNPEEYVTVIRYQVKK